MDATGGQNGAERADAPRTAPGRPLRCPECGRRADADSHYKKTGFWADPVRWMPAVLLWVLVAFQLATPVVLPGRVETVQTPSVRSGPQEFPMGTPAWFGQNITWEQIERAANGSATEIEMMAPFIHQIAAAEHYLTWVGIDPAAMITLAEGWIADNSDRGMRDEPWIWLGLFDIWMYGFEFHGAGPVPTFGDWLNYYLPLPGNSPGFRNLTLRPEVLAFTLVQTAICVWLLRLVGRPFRRGCRRAWFRSPWVWLTIFATVGLAAFPTHMGPRADLVQAYPQQPSTYTGFQQTDLTVERLRLLANGPEPAVAVARAIVDARSHPTNEVVRLRFSNRGQWIASISAEPRTPATQSSVTLGWPTPYVQLGVREKSIPNGAAETRGRFRVVDVQRSGFRFQTNAGAWPGRSFWMQLDTVPLSLALVLTLAAWWLFRAVLRSRLLFRGRKRAARGLCVGCGYDLKGLRRRPVVSE